MVISENKTNQTVYSTNPHLILTKEVALDDSTWKQAIHSVYSTTDAITMGLSHEMVFLRSNNLISNHFFG
jgi:hypothetical protein